MTGPIAPRPGAGAVPVPPSAVVAPSRPLAAVRASSSQSNLLFPRAAAALWPGPFAGAASSSQSPACSFSLSPPVPVTAPPGESARPAPSASSLAARLERCRKSGAVSEEQHERGLSVLLPGPSYEADGFIRLHFHDALLQIEEEALKPGRRSPSRSFYAFDTTTRDAISLFRLVPFFKQKRFEGIYSLSLSLSLSPRRVSDSGSCFFVLGRPRVLVRRQRVVVVVGGVVVSPACHVQAIAAALDPRFAATTDLRRRELERVRVEQTLGRQSGVGERERERGPRDLAGAGAAPATAGGDAATRAGILLTPAPRLLTAAAAATPLAAATTGGTRRSDAAPTHPRARLIRAALSLSLSLTEADSQTLKRARGEFCEGRQVTSLLENNRLGQARLLLRKRARAGLFLFRRLFFARAPSVA